MVGIRSKWSKRIEVYLGKISKKYGERPRFQFLQLGGVVSIQVPSSLRFLEEILCPTTLPISISHHYYKLLIAVLLKTSCNHRIVGHRTYYKNPILDGSLTLLLWKWEYVDRFGKKLNQRIIPKFWAP